jgi:hypothetical protein
MPKQDVDVKQVRISATPPSNSAIKQVDDVFIVITQAFCPNGHNLIADFSAGDYDFECDFDGFPGLKLCLESAVESAEVVLSPFHGDSSKKGKTDWRAGSKLNVLCPQCRTPLPRLASCRCPENGDLVKVYLSPSLTDSHVLALCNVWGCRRSHTIDNWEIISEYLDGQIDE